MRPLLFARVQRPEKRLLTVRGWRLRGAGGDLKAGEKGQQLNAFPVQGPGWWEESTVTARGERKIAGHKLSPCKSADLCMASSALKAFLLIYAGWRSEAGASLCGVRGAGLAGGSLPAIALG